jgi:hypothetical protein
MRKEKKNKVVRLHTLLSDTYDSKVELLKIWEKSDNRRHICIDATDDWRRKKKSEK